MSDNQAIRRFFRREFDERVTHVRDYGSLLGIVGYQALENAISDPEVTVDRITNFEERLSDFIECQVSWRSVETGCETSRQYRNEAWVFLVHHGLGDLQLVVALVEEHRGEIQLKVVMRSDDSDRMPEVIAWLDRLEERQHPLKGRLFSLDASALRFLPSQGVGRADLILAEDVLQTIEHHFAFLEDPAGYPGTLRRGSVLLSGKPGVGKTMLAKWLAHVYPSTTVIWAPPSAIWELGASRVFEVARRLRPTLVILEDLDLAAGQRRGGEPLGDLLAQLDGFADLKDIGVLATTNHPETLDEALDPIHRPGRFDQMIRIGSPDEHLRSRLLSRLLETSEVLGTEVDDAVVQRLAALTDGRTGAQLAETVREAERLVIYSQRSGQLVDPSTVLLQVARRRSGAVSTLGFADAAGL